MIPATRRLLAILAAVTWYVGGIVLVLKGGSLLLEARELRPGHLWPITGLLLGLVVGSLKARFIFHKSGRKNLERIATLRKPKIWQFFSPKFFLMLGTVIPLGVVMSRFAHGHFPLLIGVGALDLSIATALLVSSIVFWR
jgi:hypothetical protein